jgi:probable addiction module antidote protein
LKEKVMKANNVIDGLSLFDITDYLLTGEDVSEYLRQVIADKDAEELVRALKDIDRSVGMAELTKATGMTSAGLLESMSNPRSK